MTKIYAAIPLTSLDRIPRSQRQAMLDDARNAAAAHYEIPAGRMVWRFDVPSQCQQLVEREP